MDPVCSCIVVSIHFIVLSHLSPITSSKLFHYPYDSFYVFCFHQYIDVSAPLLPSMMYITFQFIYDIVMRITLTPWHRVPRVKVLVLGNHCVLVILWGLLSMMKALWGVLTIVSSSCEHVTYQSLWKVSYDFLSPAVMPPYN